MHAAVFVNYGAFHSTSAVVSVRFSVWSRNIYIGNVLRIKLKDRRTISQVSLFDRSFDRAGVSYVFKY